MRCWVAAVAGWVAVSASSACALAEPQDPETHRLVERLLGLVGDDIVAVRPYTPGGLDLNRGYELDTRPRQDNLGDCRTQRITFFTRQHPLREGVENAPDSLGELVVTNRYQRPGWVRSTGPSECADPNSGTWTVANDDVTFYRAAEALGRVARALDGEGFVPAISCTEYGKPCPNPARWLSETIAKRIAYVRFEGSTLVAYGTPGGWDSGWVMRVEIGRGAQPTDVKVEFRVPPLA